MNFERLNSWLTLVANMGVIAGIIFLALEIDQSNRQARSATYQARVNEIDQSLREFSLSESMAEIYLKIEQSGLESLTPSEHMRAENWERARIIRMQGQLYQYQLGFLDENSYEGLLVAGSRALPRFEAFGLTSELPYRDLVTLLESIDQD